MLSSWSNELSTNACTFFPLDEMSADDFDYYFSSSVLTMVVAHIVNYIHSNGDNITDITTSSMHLMSSDMWVSIYKGLEADREVAYSLMCKEKYISLLKWYSRRIIGYDFNHKHTSRVKSSLQSAALSDLELLMNVTKFKLPPKKNMSK